MKFKTGPWLDIGVLPVQEGTYEVKLPSGEKAKAIFQSGTWRKHPADFTEWRGRVLKGMSSARQHRESVDSFRTALPRTYPTAVESAVFLARHAVSLNYKKDAYRYYLIANAIDRTRLKRVDKQWLKRFAMNSDVRDEQRKADKFFERCGGRPRQA
ncbi:hypothetical protein ACTHR6_17155 [Ralstonia holmesii]|uniref:hypothetical protein n=1 Tax=Ralstonia TaxID=48736 RepID=UPI0004692F59|nr:hypothetical protein [Ralstonia pickettii]